MWEDTQRGKWKDFVILPKINPTSHLQGSCIFLDPPIPGEGWVDKRIKGNSGKLISHIVWLESHWAMDIFLKQMYHSEAYQSW